MVPIPGALHLMSDKTTFIADVLRNPVNRAIMERLPELGLNDAWLVSGALFQTVWNVKTGRAPEHGIKDYDIFYFDPDTSWGAENDAIENAQRIFAGLPGTIELRNQARVHIWYPEKFGIGYPPLTRATDGIDLFLMHCAQVGLRPLADEFELYTPRGFDDIYSMIIRPSQVANFQALRFQEKAARWRQAWPEVTVMAPMMPADI